MLANVTCVSLVATVFYSYPKFFIVVLVTALTISFEFLASQLQISRSDFLSAD